MMLLVDEYLAVRRAAGFELVTTGNRLRSFARFAEARREDRVSATTAVAWASAAPSPCQRHLRLRDVAVWVRYLRAEDPTHELPDVRVFPRDRRERLPHIFSQEEVGQILQAAGRLGPARSSRADTCRTLFGLLASTGLRIGEACRFDLSDITAEGLLVRASKFRKSRLLPLHTSTSAALELYRAQWRSLAGPADPLFVSINGARLSPGSARSTFAKIISDLGLRRGAASAEHGRRGPCLHDFRHTFAVRSLEACPTSRREIGRHLLALSTYLGHASVASTYWYLKATPHLMGDIADACRAWHEGGVR